MGPHALSATWNTNLLNLLLVYRVVSHSSKFCKCGHVFTLKREAHITASSPVKRKKALKSMEYTLQRQEKNRTRMASMRGSKTKSRLWRG